MAKNTIKVTKYSTVQEEITSTAAEITPGHLLELTSASLVQKHSTAAGVVNIPMFALEDELQGGGIDKVYPASNRVQVYIPYRGDIVYALLADGANVAVGAALESAGDGTLKAKTTGTVVGIALEAVDLSASANDAPARILVKIA